MDAVTPRKSKRQLTETIIENIRHNAKQGKAMDRMLDRVDHAEHTFSRRKLFSNSSKDGEEVDIPEDFVVINTIISGPWLDAHGDIIFWCNVDGWFGKIGDEEWLEGHSLQDADRFHADSSC